MRNFKVINVIMTVGLLLSLGIMIASFFFRYWIYKFLAIGQFCGYMFFTYIVGYLIEKIEEQDLKFQEEIDKIRKRIMYEKRY